MVKSNILRTVAALAVMLWCGIALAATHQQRVHHDLQDGLPQNIKLRSESVVEPFLITIITLHSGPNSTLPAALPQNISAYLVGDAPNPVNPAQRLGFVAQHSDDGSTKYFTPPSNAGKGAVVAAPATLSYKNGAVRTSFKTPGTVNSGRIYIVVDGYLNFYASPDGKIVQPDPHNPSDIAHQELWGFIELTHARDPSTGDENMVVNLSFVDWVSLPLGISITSKSQNGSLESVAIGGLEPTGLAKVCKTLSALDGFWPRLCIRGPDKTPLRVMSPGKYLSIHSDDKDAANYYEPYINTAWEKYKDVDLRINTQASGPNSGNKVDNGQIVTCRVGHTDNILHCDNDAGDFIRPVSKDIYGCDSGPFANPQNGATESWSRARVRPRLCAAFVRSTLHLDGVQPSHDITPDQYYREPITNHYSRVVHDNLMGGMGYAFSYDDVNPGRTENSAGLISTTHPIRLDIYLNI
ncbi:hypothetical protein E0Z10_g9061 [Xylaria hypoxylon]|uniref:GH64 domain-containing protein n=1 Tax=Xylaria hypoxylon TaxID=37992 RepID=A0A4Z0YLE5_9PEZI|nr:hypothetical protein E0Z10_g9061 [Xylaria hypoxylon]